MGPFRAQTVYQMVAGFFRHTVIADNRFYCWYFPSEIGAYREDVCNKRHANILLGCRVYIYFVNRANFTAKLFMKTPQFIA